MTVTVSSKNNHDDLLRNPQILIMAIMTRVFNAGGVTKDSDISKVRDSESLFH